MSLAVGKLVLLMLESLLQFPALEDERGAHFSDADSFEVGERLTFCCLLNKSAMDGMFAAEESNLDAERPSIVIAGDLIGQKKYLNSDSLLTKSTTFQESN